MMKNPYFYLPLFAFISLQSCSQGNVPDEETQIAMAVQAAPESEREEATVFGYDSDGVLKLLRQGTNYLICLSDDFNTEGFQSVCYHKDLETFMARGRELRTEGKSFQEIFDIREAEAKEGTLKMPEKGATLHVLEGPDANFDLKSGKVVGANYRYVVYIPWATAESTGLPLSPMVQGGPWLMNPGTHRAHIMITPPPKEEK